MKMGQSRSCRARSGTGSGAHKAVQMLLATTILSAASLSVQTSTMAQSQPAASALQSIAFNIPPQSLASALDAFIRQSGWQISYSSALVRGKQSGGIQGSATAGGALHRLVVRTGIGVKIGASGSAALVGAAENITGSVDAGNSTVLDTIKVEGEEGAWGPVTGIVASRSATGTKTDTPLIEVPQSISVITADEIEARGAETIKEAVNYTAGVHVGGSSASTRAFDNIEIRGFAPTPLYFEGTYLPYIGDLGGSPQIDPCLLERVEVLKGPSSVLYGQNYPGGIVNMVSKRPTDASFHEVVVGTGTDGRTYGAFDFSGPVADNDALLYRLTGVATRTETNIDKTKDDRLLLARFLQASAEAI